MQLSCFNFLEDVKVASKRIETAFSQQLEHLGVLPIKLRGGLGQRPETWHLPPGS